MEKYLSFIKTIYNIEPDFDFACKPINNIKTYKASCECYGETFQTEINLTTQIKDFDLGNTAILLTLNLNNKIHEYLETNNLTK